MYFNPLNRPGSGQPQPARYVNPTPQPYDPNQVIGDYSRQQPQYAPRRGGFGMGMGAMVQYLQQLLQSLQSMFDPTNPDRQQGCWIHAPGLVGGIQQQGWIPQPIQEGIQAVAMKPAIYLYPDQTQIINVMLDPSIEVLIDIPRHKPNSGWTVLAHPDGTLVDLQPELTDLADFDVNELGMEYLQDVRDYGTYPYIYWDGTQTQQPMPTQDDGWIIEKADLERFLTEALQTMAFNDAEAREFLSFWIPKLQEDQAATHYRLGFLQNEAVQNYLPIQVTPFPASFNRILMLAEANPLDHQPDLTLSPQALVPIDRTGYTLVEWGGIICPSGVSLNRLMADKGALALTE